jgi:predicted metal-binding protein
MKASASSSVKISYISSFDLLLKKKCEGPCVYGWGLSCPPNREVMRTCRRRQAVEDHLFLYSDFFLSFLHAVYIV